MYGIYLGYAVRTLVKSPVFFTTTVLTIALGIGASTAIFSVTDAVLLRPLPYTEPNRLVLIGGDLRTRNIFDERVSYENYSDLRNTTTSVFADMAAVATFRNIVPKADGTPEQVKTAVITTNFFRVMGARIAVGRDFEDADGQATPPPDPAADSAKLPTPPPTIAILSYEYWQRRFGGNSAIFGHPMQNGGPNSPLIVGALAPGFELQFRESSNVERLPDMWTALRLNYDNRNRNTYFLRGIGRLKAGASIKRAEELAKIAAAEVRKNFPVYGGGGFYYHLEPMQAHLVAEVRPTILALMGAVIFLLLITCANVSSLMLVRLSVRERDLAVRAALGASRGRLIRQLFAESLLVAMGGTILGIFLAYAGIRELISISPANLPRVNKVSLDPVVLLFSISSGLAAAVVFGIVPALRASRPDLMQVLRGSGRTAALGGGGLRNLVVVGEIALSFVLLIGSGLMLRSFIELQRIDLGFDPQHLLTLQLLGGRAGAKPQELAARIREIQERLQNAGGVERVTASALVPLGGGYSTIRWGKEDALSDPSRFQAADAQTVLPGFFETMRTPLIAGRTFTEADNAPDRKFVIIDDLLAAKAFPHESAIGRRILIRLRTPEPEWVEVIGVVAHQRATSIAERGHEQLYFTDGYGGYGTVNRWILRTSGDPARVAPAVRASIRQYDPSLLIDEMKPMSSLVDRAQDETRFSLLLIALLAVIAVVLAAGGLYGVLSTLVRQRTAEIGVRMAMGAAPAEIFGFFVSQGLRLSAMGVAIGMAAAFGLTQAMATMLVGVSATDPATFAAIVILFLAISALACAIPAARASSLDPNVALRE